MCSISQSLYSTQLTNCVSLQSSSRVKAGFHCNARITRNASILRCIRCIKFHQVPCVACVALRWKSALMWQVEHNTVIEVVYVQNFNSPFLVSYFFLAKGSYRRWKITRMCFYLDTDCPLNFGGLTSFPGEANPVTICILVISCHHSVVNLLRWVKSEVCWTTLLLLPGFTASPWRCCSSTPAKTMVQWATSTYSTEWPTAVTNIIGCLHPTRYI